MGCGLTATSVSGLSRILCWRRGTAQTAGRKGTPIMKPATVNGDRYKKYKEVHDRGGHPRDQGENARTTRPHDLHAAGWCKATHGEGVMEAIQDAVGDIILELQPANSPDHVDDLDFFLHPAA
ncbi:unnamed protein product [Discosporangium mesarthrocarpum]